ncbi:hypothetical protein CHU98_g4984 [Xylaria longipes]|nr:hypothetical protein CHU98_g4984 [Xylaria longipes]
MKDKSTSSVSQSVDTWVANVTPALPVLASAGPPPHLDLWTFMEPKALPFLLSQRNIDGPLPMPDCGNPRLKPPSPKVPRDLRPRLNF